ncbi:MAG TPA: efflux RND transporter permease subunit, partial [Myxococcota bacterium]|nr:efflux RND transporter permease subunit [Myxococcota bacterium]
PGVGRVEIWGVDEPMVWVDFRRDALGEHGVDLAALMGRLASDNFQLASGSLEDRGAIRLVRSLSRFDQLEELKNYPVQEGLRLSDVADIRYEAAARADINRIEGKNGAAFTVNKESSANTVELCAELVRTLAELEKEPELAGYQFPIFFNQGHMVEEAVDNLIESALEGGILAVLVLVLFLREWRITALIVATIPASLLLTVIVLYFQGRSLNLLSMLGLMLAVGMVVDNAVVVVETIYRRRQGGQDPVTAAIEGTAEVLLPITLSTLTSIVVFLPIILMSDSTSSMFLSEIGMPVVYIQVGSLLITLLFTPLSTVWLGNRTIHEDPRWVRWLAAKVD